MTKEQERALKFGLFMVTLLLISICVGCTAYNLQESKRLETMCGPTAYPVERIYPNMNPIRTYLECVPRP